MKNIFRIAVMLLMFISFNLFAQEVKKDSLRFSGTVKDVDGLVKNFRMNISYYTNDAFSPSGQHKIELNIEGNGHFSFYLPNLKKPYKLFIAIYTPNSAGLTNYRKLFDNQFFVEPGDDINFNVKIELDEYGNELGTSCVFKGKGSDKYNLIWNLQRVFFKEYIMNLGLRDLAITVIFKDSLEMSSQIRNLKQLIGIYRIKKSSLIASANLSPLMSEIINNEFGAYDGGFNSEWLLRMRWLYKENPLFQKQIGNYYLQHSQEFYKRPNNAARYSNSYQYELINRSIFQTIITTNSNQPSLTTVYNNIKNEYGGLLRDKVLGLLLTKTYFLGRFQNYTTYNVIDSLLKDALNIIPDPHIKNVIQEKIIEFRNLNTKVLDAEFISQNGDKFKLNSLAGKVILLDVWFNGCFGCADFHKNFKNVYPQFKDNKNFVVLSVNVDKDKDSWIKGIESNLYTSKDYIQVTTANWFNHPFMKYYNITGASYVMVIDSGGRVLAKASSVENIATQITSALKNIETPK